jgi:polyphosphate kinase
MQLPMPPQGLPLDDPALYINRELSWLEFNRRVLEEAQDPTVPLLERLKFVAIVESNLDEFYMVRVGGLQQKLQAGVAFGSGADRTPVVTQVEMIDQVVRQLMGDTYRVLMGEILPALDKEGIVLRGLKDLTDADRKHLQTVFNREIFPVLTPLAIDPGHPFPHLMNKSLNLAVILERPGDQEKLFAVVQVPSVLPRFVPLPDGGARQVFTTLETVIRLHLEVLFPGMKHEHNTLFRVTRNSDFEIDDDDVEDLLKTIEEEIRKRRRGAAVRMQIEQTAAPQLVQFLTAALDLDPTDVHQCPGLLDLTSLFQIYSLPGYPTLRDPSFAPQQIPEFTVASSMWSAIRARDILVHHPYESFSHVVDFIETAATDDRVLAIKQTLYRTSSDSPIVRALARAADNGKQVTAVLELKARLDEERNILWAQQLEKAGVHVVYGFVNLKTHCKVALVVRREDDGIRRYVHLATGNYNPMTARIYTDLGLFTCNPDFCDDASALFNYLTGYCELPEYRKLIVAPSRMQNFMLEKIEQERQLAAAGKEGKMLVKINGLLEPAVTQALYRASQAGVKILIVCRGISNLRPGLPGYSENIRVVSIVDRFLEHSRIYYFGNNGDPQVYIGSADWMDRNLSRRVEVVFPIEQPDLKKRLIDEILATTFADNVKMRELQPDGTYRRVVPAENQPRIRSQQRFLELAAETNARKLAEFQTLPPMALLDSQPTEPRRARKARRS